MEPGFEVPAKESEIRSRWRENHGNLILAFVGLILLVGSCVLIYRQNRFVPPRFPDSRLIVLQEIGGGEGTVELKPEEVVFIHVTGAANDFGTIKIAIYEDEQTFNRSDAAFAISSLPLEGGEALWVVPVAGLPAQLAIAAYHDENGDQQLNLNRFGIPSERYGFSRNARGLTGPPSFQQTVIDRPEGGETLHLFIR